MINDFSQVHEDLRVLKQFCARAGKQPYVWDSEKGRLVPQGWQIDCDKWLKFEDAIQFLENGTEVYHKGTPWKIEGIGILVVGDGKDHAQLLGGDLDCVRDPETGILSEWAKKILNDIQPFYTEVSPSKCGIRFFVMGRLPNALKQITGFGPQKDLPVESKERIFKAKPAARGKVTEGNPAFNGIEFHESSGLYKDTGKYSAKHLTITGWRLTDYCYPKEDRTIAICEAMRGLIEEKPIEIKPIAQNVDGQLPNWAKSMDETSREGLFPKLNILAVIGRTVDLSTFYESGGQLFGSHPLGSTTGHNLIINPSENKYAYMRPSPPVGGDPWVWLAHECGASPWNVPGEGLLRDPVIKRKTLEYAAAQGLIDPALIIHDPEIRTVSLDDAPGATGRYSDGTIREVVLNKDGVKVLNWISDCSVMLHTETREDDITEFTFFGIGARDGLKICLTLQASDMADPRKFKGALINAFGGTDRVGKLNWEMIQGMSRNVIKKQRVTIPCWRKDTPLIPGVDLANDVEFKLAQITPANVYDGDIKLAANVLKKLITLRKYTPILVVTVLGAPIYAKWFNRDRFGLALWGKSGSQKTTIAKIASAVYGVGFLEEHALIKHGRNGATLNGAMDALLLAGILCRIVDNVKATDPKDIQQYIALIHGTLEGGEKLRSRKEGGLRKTKSFLATPIITGEIRPAEASTSARVLNLSWHPAKDSERLSDIQEDIGILPVVGYHWLRFLATCGRDLRIGFEDARTKKYNEYLLKNYTNAGRLATIYCLLRATWALACESPFAEIFQETMPQFIEALDQAIEEQGALVTEETEVSKFLAGLNELVVSRPDLFMIGEMPTGADKTLGKQSDLGLFVLPNETLAMMKQLGIFTQIPNVASLTDALVEENILVPPKSKDRRLYQLRVNGTWARGWLLVANWCDRFGDMSGYMKPETEDPCIRNSRCIQGERERKFVEGEKRENENIRATPDTSDTDKESKVIDIDNNVIDCNQVCSQYVADDGNSLLFLDQPTKTKIWSAVGHILRNLPCKEPGRLGLFLCLLSSQTKLPESQLKQILEASGWVSAPIEASGLIVWWAPEKVLKAYNLEAA